MNYVTLDEAQKKLPDLIRATECGDQIVITKEGTPVATLQAVNQLRSGFGSMKGLIKISDDFDDPLEDFAEYI